MYRYNRFDENKISDFFALDDSHFTPLYRLRFNKIELFLNEEIYYCPICMNFGYHSYFHQLKFMIKCIFHNTKLIKAVDENQRTALYCLSSLEYEAYKNGSNKNTRSIKKYLEVPSASHLIVNEYENYHPDIVLMESKYDIIRFFDPLSQQMREQIKDSTYSFMYKAFCNEKIDKKEVINITVYECEQFYNKLCSTVQDYCLENYLDYNENSIQEWFLCDILQNYIITIDDFIMKTSLRILHNYEIYKSSLKEKNNITESDFRNAATVIMLAFYITHANTVYEGIIDLRKVVSKYNKSTNCNLIFNDLISIRIDNEKFSFYLSYLIFERLIRKTYIKIKTVIDEIDISEISTLLDLNINSFPNYIILKKENKYRIYEID